MQVVLFSPMQKLPQSRPPRVLGLMTGTSVDGIDAVLTELPGYPGLGASGTAPALSGPAPRVTVLDHHFTPFRDDLRAALLAAGRNEATTSDLTQLGFWLGEALAEAAAELAGDADLIASHGQTVHHIPHLDAARGWHTRSTLQIGEAAVIVERTGKPVISDFRPFDLAAGGQAAPLVPFADRIMYAEAGVRRAVHNLGGISNLTYLPGLDEAGVVAFDTGPANALIDEAAELFGQRRDEGGQMGAGGHVAGSLVQTWLDDPYLRAAPPKSTGRERWNLQALPGVYELDAPGHRRQRHRLQRPEHRRRLPALRAAAGPRRDRGGGRRSVQPHPDDSPAGRPLPHSGADLRGARLELGGPRGGGLRGAGLLRLSGLAQHPAADDRGAARGDCREAVAACCGPSAPQG